MKLFCRDSLFNDLKKWSDFLFEVTNKSMEFYESFFGVKFPFSKYDQIFCAEFKWGAMENAVKIIIIIFILIIYEILGCSFIQ